MLASSRYPPITTDGSLERQSWPTARCSWRLLKGGSMSAAGRDPLSLPAGSYTLRTSPRLPSCWQPSRRPHGSSSAGSWSRTRRIRRFRSAGTGTPNGMIPWLFTAPRTPRPTSSRPPLSSRYLPRRRPYPYPYPLPRRRPCPYPCPYPFPRRRRYPYHKQHVPRPRQVCELEGRVLAARGYNAACRVPEGSGCTLVNDGACLAPLSATSHLRSATPGGPPQP